MKFWLILGGLFLLTRKPAPVTTPAGGMSPVQSAGDSMGNAIDSVSGGQVNVVQPLQTTVVGQISPASTFALDSSDESILGLPSLNPVLAAAGPAQVPQFLPNPDTMPNAWPGLAAPTSPAPAPTTSLAMPAGDPRGTGSAVIMAPFDLTQDSFFVPGLGEEDFSPGVSADAKLAILQAQGYTGPDTRQVPTTSLGAAQDTTTVLNPVSGRVMLPNV